MPAKKTCAQARQGQEGGKPARRAARRATRKPAERVKASAARVHAAAASVTRKSAAAGAEAPPRQRRTRDTTATPGSRRSRPAPGRVAADAPSAAPQPRARRTPPRPSGDDGEGARARKPAGRPAQRTAVHRQARRAVHEQGAARAFPQILQHWKRDLMEEVDRTVSHMKDEAANFPTQRPRDPGRGVQPRAAHPRSRAQADPQDRRGAQAHRGRHLWLLPGDRRGDRHQAPGGPAGRHPEHRGPGAPRAARAPVRRPRRPLPLTPQRACTAPGALYRPFRPLAHRAAAPRLAAGRRRQLPRRPPATAGAGWCASRISTPRASCPAAPTQILRTLESFGLALGWRRHLPERTHLALYAAALRAAARQPA